MANLYRLTWWVASEWLFRQKIWLSATTWRTITWVSDINSHTYNLDEPMTILSFCASLKWLSTIAILNRTDFIGWPNVYTTVQTGCGWFVGKYVTGIMVITMKICLNAKRHGHDEDILSEIPNQVCEDAKLAWKVHDDPKKLYPARIKRNVRNWHWVNLYRPKLLQTTDANGKRLESG